MKHPLIGTTAEVSAMLQRGAGPPVRSLHLGKATSGQSIRWGLRLARLYGGQHMAACQSKVAWAFVEHFGEIATTAANAIAPSRLYNGSWPWILQVHTIGAPMAQRCGSL
jgi:hypothetical protein